MPRPTTVLLSASPGRSALMRSSCANAAEAMRKRKRAAGFMTARVTLDRLLPCAAMALTSKQRQYLKGLAHSLEPIVRVGRAGASPSVVEETKRSLASHELIKVRIENDDSAQRRTLGEELARACDAEVAGSIGK